MTAPHPLEIDIQNRILGTIGCVPGVLAFRNAIDHRGAAKYGLGEGSPDLVMWVAPWGRLIGLEVKRPGEKPTEKQLAVHAQWRARGAYVAVVHSVEEAWVAVGKALEMSASKDAWADWGDVLPAPPNGFVVFDTETTGLSKNDRIVEIAAVKVENSQIVDRFEQLVNPEMDVPAQASAIHGISNYQLRDQPLADEVLTNFRRFVGLHPLMAHNASFDVRMLRAESERTSVLLPFVPVYCTAKIARAVLPKTMQKSHALAALRDRYGIPPARAHRAMPDVLVLVGVLRQLAKDLARSKPGMSLRDVHGPAEVLCALGHMQDAEEAPTERPAVKPAPQERGTLWAS